MKSRVSPYALAACLVVGGGVAWLQCGKSAVCGNGKVEGDEQCDKGPDNGVDGSGCSSSCMYANIAVASIQVSYSKLLDEVPGFGGVSCNDLGIGAAHVVLAGPMGSDEVWMGCMQSKMYTNVQPGTYQATITLLDASMNPLTNPVMTAMADVEKGPVTNLAVNFHMSDFVKQDYTGNLDFDPNWGAAGKRCADAGVTKEAVTIVDSKGAAVTMPAMTSDGLAIDGSFGSCFTASQTTQFERLGPMTWGHYTITIQGKGPMGVQFCKAFPVFVAPNDSLTNELVVDAYDPSSDAGACP